MFCMQYPVKDKVNYDIKEIWVTQIIKSIYLFQFLESIEKYDRCVAFLVHFSCNSWQDAKALSLIITCNFKTKEKLTDIVGRGR